jgi:hypothetical protein
LAALFGEAIGHVFSLIGSFAELIGRAFFEVGNLVGRDDLDLVAVRIDPVGTLRSSSGRIRIALQAPRRRCRLSDRFP